jgi:gamma-glutamyltranspeptidase/glutathione hydrolase
MLNRFALFAVIVLIGACIVRIDSAATQDRVTSREVPRGRSVTFAANGMVATSHPLAAQIGLDVLKQGGNAVDAAIATSAAMGLMEPMSCGIGGDLFAIVWDAKSKKLYGLNASGRSPYRATMAFFREKGLDLIPTLGPLSWSVPGCVDGWDQLQKRFGTRSLARLLEPSIRYAEEGVPVPEVIAGYWKSSESGSVTPEFAKTYLPNGKAPRTGEIFRNPLLARTYRDIAKGGRDACYKGRIAREIVSYSDRVGGLFSLKDFEDHSSTWVEPVSTNYRGYDVWEIPPNGQGISALQMLNILEGYELGKFGHDSANYWHLWLEAKKLAFADRARYYADPEFSKVPTKELISKPYAASRRKLISMEKALEDIQPGDPKLGGDTIYLTVVDKDRNCVSLINSNYLGFGSGHVPGDLGFALQNRGTSFALDPRHPNRLEPHKRPFHTIIPAMVTKDGKPWFCFGVMGGDMQPQGHVQILCNLIDFGMNVQQVGEAPRMEHLYSASPKGIPARGSGEVEAERGFPEEMISELRRRGHVIKFVDKNGGGYQGILIDPVTNTLQGGSEPRKDGLAVGY